jgi:hypothetical protein
MASSRTDMEAAITASLQTANEEEEIRKAIALSLQNLTNPDTSNDAAIAAALQDQDGPVEVEMVRDREEMRANCLRARQNERTIPAAQAMARYQKRQEPPPRIFNEDFMRALHFGSMFTTQPHEDETRFRLERNKERARKKRGNCHLCCSVPDPALSLEEQSRWWYDEGMRLQQGCATCWPLDRPFHS